MSSLPETIAAAATPPGASALGVIRLSGSNSLKIADKIFSPLAKNKIPSKLKTHSCCVGNIMDSKEIIDRAMISVMKAPSSYTGEDMVEFSCHGSMLIISRVLQLCLSCGARTAEPGEFTKRAFLNGKMDLTRAEGVNNLIRARTDNSRRQAMRLLRGALEDKTEKIRSSMEELKMLFDADIEWGETEDIDFFHDTDVKNQIKEIKKEIAKLIKRSSPAESVVEGYRVVICGKPNAGKSSLFNSLLRLTRSITSKIPGTTRNVIEAETVIKGFLLRLVDTAGIGLKKKTEIDTISAYKSREEIKEADMVIYAIDSSAGIEKIDYKIREILENKEWIPVLNKTDLKSQVTPQEIKEFAWGREVICVSCKEKKGVSKLGGKLAKELGGTQSEKLMLSIRQKSLLKEMFNTIKRVFEEFTGNRRQELVSFELNQALDILGRIDGRTSDENMLNRIFENFCIGK